MITVTYRYKKTSIRFSSQLSLLFSNINGSKYENRLPYNIFLVETQPHPWEFYHFRQNTQLPRSSEQFTQKSAETFSLRKILSPNKLDEKAGILRCERMETIIHFRKNMMA